MGAAVAGGDGNRFRTLVLDGHEVRWPAAASGHSGRVLTWDLVAAPIRFAGAVNCGRMDRPDALLARSHLAKRQFEAELDAAFAMWSAVAPLSFVRARDGQAADILIGAQGDPDGYAFTNVTRVPGRDEIASAAICLNPERAWKIGFDGNLAVFDLRYTLAHELGHALGLDHPARTGVLMGWHYGERFRELQAGDIAGIRQLYGAPATATSELRSAAHTIAPEPNLGLVAAP